MPKYCIMGDEITIRFEKDGTYVDMKSEGDVLHTMYKPSIFGRAGDTLTIVVDFLHQAPQPKQYSVEDLVQLIKKGES